MYIRNLSQISEAEWAELTGDVDKLDYVDGHRDIYRPLIPAVDKTYSPDPARELEEIEDELLIETDYAVIRKLKVRRRILREQLKEENGGN